MLNIFKIKKEEIELSANQKFLMRERSAIGSLGPIKIKHCSKDNLERKIRKFLNKTPVLCIKIRKQNDKIYQQQIAAHDVLLDIKYEEVNVDFDLEELEEKSLAYLSKPYDFFDGELIRVLALIDKNKKEIHLTMGIHHVITDMHSNSFLEQNLLLFLNKKKVIKNSFSNYDFVKWQTNFLLSKQGWKHRDYWINSFKNIESKKENLSLISEILTENNSKFVFQKFIIKDKNLVLLNKILSSLNLPITALFLSLHQRLINKINVKGSKLLHVRVDGREEMLNGLDVNSALGMISNTIPLQIVSDKGKSPKEFMLEVFVKYCEARANQCIPYEIIRQDFYSKAAIDIDQCRIGVFNFKIENDVKYYCDVSNYYNVKTKEFQSKDAINLEAILYKDAIQVIFSCPEDMYKKHAQSIKLDDFIRSQILGQSNQKYKTIRE
ncbi:condensation domain-containing protein [Aquimarina sp. M1]